MPRSEFNKTQVSSVIPTVAPEREAEESPNKKRALLMGSLDYARDDRMD